MAEACRKTERERAILDAVRHKRCRWSVVYRHAQQGTSVDFRQKLCIVALNRKMWMLVVKLVEMGVGVATRDLVVDRAVAEHKVICAVRTLRLGISSGTRTRLVSHLVVNSSKYPAWRKFVVALLKACDDTSLLTDVLNKAVKLKGNARTSCGRWRLILAMAKSLKHQCSCQTLCSCTRRVSQSWIKVLKKAVLGKYWTWTVLLVQRLSHMFPARELEHICEIAVSCAKWQLALAVIKTGKVFSAPAVMRLFDEGVGIELMTMNPVPTGLKPALLLATAVYCSDPESFQEILRQCSDMDVLEAIKIAEEADNKEGFQRLIRCSGRCRRVLLQYLPHREWRQSADGHHVYPWIYQCLMTEGSLEVEERLAYYVAMYATQNCMAARDFVAKTRVIGGKNKKFWLLIKKIYDCECSLQFCEDHFVESLLTRAEGKLIASRLYRFLVRESKDKSFRDVIFHWKRIMEIPGIADKYGETGAGGRKYIHSVRCLGVTLQDLKYAVRWIFASDQPVKNMLSVCTANLDEDARQKVLEYRARHVLDWFFKHPTEAVWKDMFCPLFLPVFFCRDRNKMNVADKILLAAMKRAVSLHCMEIFSYLISNFFSKHCLAKSFPPEEDCECSSHTFCCHSVNKRGQKLCMAFKRLLSRQERELYSIYMSDHSQFQASDLPHVFMILANFMFQDPDRVFIPPGVTTAARRLKLLEVEELLKYYFYQMFQGEELGAAKLAPIADWWIREVYFTIWGNPRILECVESTSSCSRDVVKFWADCCLRQSHLYVALVLAVFIQDWSLVDALLGKERLDIASQKLKIMDSFSGSDASAHPQHGWNTDLQILPDVLMGCAMKNKSFTSAAGLLMFYPSAVNPGNHKFALFERCTLHGRFTDDEVRLLIQACMERGLNDWALRLCSYRPSLVDELEKLDLLNPQKKYALGTLNAAVEFLAFNGGEVSLKASAAVVQLLTKFSYSCKNLRDLVEKAVVHCRWDSLRVLLSVVDHYVYVLSINETKDDISTILHYAAHLVDFCDLVVYFRLCFEAGLASYHRKVTTGNSREILLTCMLDIPAFGLLLKSGAVRCEHLKDFLTLLTDSEHVDALVPSDDEMAHLMLQGLTWEQCQEKCKAMLREVLCSAPRLEHLARLALSEFVGYGPAREENIEASGVSRVVKDLLAVRI